MSQGLFYDYWRSSAGWRVRIGLALKGFPGAGGFAGPEGFSRIAVNLAPAISEQSGEAWRAINPQGRVPALVLAQDPPVLLTQSLAILEWLDEIRPQPAFLPADPTGRAAARAFALSIACDIHPLNNVSVLSFLRRQFMADDAAISAWCQEWLRIGLGPLEENLRRRGYQSGFIFGEAPGFAEICLIPQLYNARRFQLDLAPFPLLREVEAACLALPAFADSAPERQPDAPPPQ